jgi:hypothetical protein
MSSDSFHTDNGSTTFLRYATHNKIHTVSHSRTRHSSTHIRQFMSHITVLHQNKPECCYNQFLTPWTVASAISCWRSLWRGQNFVRELERIQNSTWMLLRDWSLAHTRSHNSSRDTLLYDALSGFHPQPLDTPWLSSVKLMSQPTLPLFFYFRHEMKASSFSLKGNVDGFTSISASMWCGLQNTSEKWKFCL